ncbi:MAG: DUF2268 domain-containing protein [Chloroflexota bacterium]|nr:DUF2268 domain-containing protein [Chloroflexota bacterium]
MDRFTRSALNRSLWSRERRIAPGSDRSSEGEGTADPSNPASRGVVGDAWGANYTLQERVQQTDNSALITILTQDPVKQTAALESKVLTELVGLGVVPPFKLDTICEVILKALVAAMEYPVVLRPHTTQDEGVSGMAYIEDGKVVLLYIPSDDPIQELLSKLHELSHVFLHHPIPKMEKGYHLKGFRAKDVYDVEAEMSAAFIKRLALSATDEIYSPFGQLVDEEG